MEREFRVIQNRVLVLKKTLMNVFKGGIVISLLGGMFACDDVNSVHQEYYDRGEMIYTGVVDSLKASVGYEKVRFNWEINSDPRISKTVIYWNQKSDSVVVNVNRTDEGRMPMSYMAEYEEGNYIFEFITKDDEGHYSMTKDLVVSVLGDAYVKGLNVRKVLSVQVNEERQVKIVWGDVASLLLVYTTVEYELNGEKVTRQVPNDEKETVLDGLKVGDKYYVSSTYQPEEAFETFTSLRKEYVVE